MSGIKLANIGPTPREVCEDLSNINRDPDEYNLARLGKRPVLKRNFGFMSVLGFSCTILVTWEAIAVTFLESFANGGPAGTVYGYLFVWSGTAATFAMLGELASMAPTSGGQYHWCSMLAPRSCANFLSYVTGWLTTFGWQATLASSAFLVATSLQGALILSRPSYSPEAWHGTLLMIGVIVFSIVINIVGGRLLPKFEGFILVLHILGFFCVLVPLVYLSEHTSAHDVFTQFLNTGNWPTQSLSFFVGLIGMGFSFLGGDAAVHMAEEIHNAVVLVPRSIMSTVAINGVFGFAMLLVLLFCIGDVEAALKTPTGYPYLQIFLSGTGSMSGTLCMFAIINIMGFATCVGMLATCSRLIWSFARDHGLPGWRIWSKVSSRTNIPLYAVILTCLISILLSLINLGSATALNDLVSMSVSNLYLSYTLATALLLYRRCIGSISHANCGEKTIVNTVGVSLVWGPFHLPGIFGIIVNVYAVTYMIIAVFFSFWPTATPVTVQTMNYSIVGTAGVMILSTLYYVLRARHFYEGPIVEIFN